MSGTARSQGGLTRRGFLKTTGVAVAGVAAIGATAATLGGQALAPLTASAVGEERKAVTFHQCHCGGHCSLECTVRDGKLVHIQPNTAWEDEKYATACLKGLSEVQHVYSTERIQVPLKRVGERGEGKFERISWDEALDTLADAITSLQDQYGKNSVLVSCAVEAAWGGTGMFSMLSSIIGGQTGGFEGIDTGIGNGFEPAIGGYGGGLGYSANEPADWVNSKTVILVGTNCLESNLVQSNHFFDAKEAGAHIVVVDPNFTTTASKASQWIPIEPGTDPALFLGMISVILEHGWIDEEFMARHTSLPFLVDVETGALLADRTEEGDVGDPDASLSTTFYVWDAERGEKADHRLSVASTALEGTFDIDGRSYTTVFSLLRKQQAPYTAAWASSVTGIPEDVIVELARRYANDGPASLGWGVGGIDKYANADVFGHAGAILTALTGQYGKPGASTGFFGDGGLRFESAATLAEWELPESVAPAEDEMSAYDLRYQPNNVHGAVFAGDTMQQHFANMNATLAWLDALEFVAVLDIYHTTVTDYADLVLPVCTKFEAEEDVQSVKSCYNHVMLREKVLDPLFESKSEFAIQKALAERLGCADALPPSAEELARFSIEESDDPRLGGITLAQLREAGGVAPLTDANEIHRAFTDLAMPTESGRFEVYYEDMVSFGQALPTYEAPNEAAADNPLRETYPLQFSQPRTRFHLHNQFCDAAWIAPYCEPVVELNPIDMATRELVDGDKIETFNDRGSFKCAVRANQSVRPGTARMYEGMWSKYMDEGNVQNVTNDFMAERGYVQFAGPVIPFNDTLVEVKKA